MISKIFTELKDFFGKDNELVESVDLALKERISSPFYGYFIVSWLIINWDLLYVAFFVSQEKIFEKTQLLRNEYLGSIFPDIFSFEHWFYFLIVPFLLTIFFFWGFPYITRLFFQKYLKNQNKLKVIELNMARAGKKAEKDLVKEETELIKQKAVQEQQKKKVEKTNPEILWENEFNEFKKSFFYNSFEKIIESVYEQDGSVVVRHQYNDEVVFKVPKDLLAYVHTLGLVSLNVRANNKITLTEKGMFFVKKYSELTDKIKRLAKLEEF